MFKKLICAQCGTFNRVDHRAQGSLAGELFIWIVCLFLAGYTAFLSIGAAVVYSIWRVASKKPICGSCKADAMIDITSPKGQRLMAENKTAH